MTIAISEDRLRRAFLAAVADEEMIKILGSATYEAKSVGGIIRETGISHSTAYRKINWMLEEGLLYSERIDITPDGKKFGLFRSTPKSINIRYELGKVIVEVEYNINVLERTAQKMFSLGSD